LLETDGATVFILGAVDLTGSFTSLAQVAAQELGVSAGKSGDFSKVSTGRGRLLHPRVLGSQTLIAMGAAVQIAAQNLKER